MRRALWIMAGTLLPGVAFGQTAPSQTAIDVQNLWPAAGPQQAVTLQSSDVQPHLSLGFGLIANYMHRPLVFREDITHVEHDAVGWALTTDFVWGVGLFNRVQIGIAVPLVVAQSGEGITALVANGGPGTQLPQTALRDLRFDVGVAILQRARRTNANGFGLRVNVGGAIPIGDEQGFQGANSWTFAPLLIADYRIAGLTITFNGGVRIRETAAVGNVSWGNQVVLGAGVAYRPIPLDRLSFGVDYLALVPFQDQVNVINGGVSQPATSFTPMELFFGARYALDRGRDLEISLGGGAPLASVATVPQFRVLAGFSYSPHGFDNDNDRVPDAADNCPTVPEDIDGFQDGDGCPEPDNDGDTIPDITDRCPNAPEDVDNFEDADGCPDPDNDHDGIPDVDDECSTEPAGDRPDAGHPGCPIRDRDHDGVLDLRDQCPDEAAGPNPDALRPGCPMADVDHDGVRDSDDQCPSDPAGEHPDRFRPGCPDPDRDHDGVANELDRCPDEPETINGRTDDDGCPDAGEETVTMAGNAVIFQRAVHLRPRARALTPAEASLMAEAAQRIRGRGSEVMGVRVRVVAAPGAAGTADATRLAGLVADALAAHGITRNTINAEAAPAEPPPAGRRAATTAGEVRIVIESRRTAHAASGAPSAAPASGAPASAAPASAAPANAAPANAAPANAAPANAAPANAAPASAAPAPSAAPGGAPSASPSPAP